MLIRNGKLEIRKKLLEDYMRKLENFIFPLQRLGKLAIGNKIGNFIAKFKVVNY